MKNIIVLLFFTLKFMLSLAGNQELKPEIKIIQLKSGIVFEQTYVGNVMHGINRIYSDYNDKESYIEVNYINGLKQGFERTYLKNEGVFSEVNYIDGLRQGIKINYYKSGKIFSKENYINDKKEGIQKRYLETGEIFLEDNYKNDEIISRKEYLYGGCIRFSMFMKDNNKKINIEKQYHKNGKLAKEGKFINGKKSGIHKEYYENGRLLGESNYIDDKLDGISKVYSYRDSNGKYLTTISKTEYFHVNGILNTVKKYDKNGRLLSSENYKK